MLFRSAQFPTAVRSILMKARAHVPVIDPNTTASRMLGKNFSLFSTYFGANRRAGCKLAHILCPVDDPQMTGLGLDEPGIAGRDPAFVILGRRRAVRVLVILHKHTRGAVKHLAIVGDLAAPHPGLAFRPCRPAPRCPFGWGDEDAGLGLAIELLQVDPERAVEIEDLRPDRFARGVANPHAAQNPACFSAARKPADCRDRTAACLQTRRARHPGSWARPSWHGP